MDSPVPFMLKIKIRRFKRCLVTSLVTKILEVMRKARYILILNFNIEILNFYKLVVLKFKRKFSPGITLSGRSRNRILTYNYKKSI